MNLMDNIYTSLNEQVDKHISESETLKQEFPLIRDSIYVNLLDSNKISDYNVSLDDGNIYVNYMNGTTQKNKKITV